MTFWRNKQLKSYFQPNKTTTLDEIFKPMYVLLSVLGLFPYSVKFNKTTKCFVVVEKSLYLNLLPAVFSMMVICLFFSLHMQTLFVLSEQNSLTDVLVNQMNYILELVLLLSFCIAAYFCAFIHRHKYVKILNTVSAAWTELPFLQNSQILNHMRMHINFEVMGTLLVAFVIHSIINITREDGLWKIILVTLTFLLMHMIQFSVIACVYVLIQMVVAILKNIRENTMMYIKQTNQTQGVWNSAMKSSRPVLWKMEVSYAKACQVTNDINLCFQGPILVTTLQCFHAIVSEANIIYHGVVLSRELTTHQIINCSMWIAWQILKIHVLGHSGSLLRFEAQKIGKTLHDIPIEDQDSRLLLENQLVFLVLAAFTILGKSLSNLWASGIFASVSEAVFPKLLYYIKIQHFSTQMNFQEMVLSIYGFFPVNATLLFNIITAATMYLIIFVQLDQSHQE